MTSVPASCTFQSNSTPVASRARRVASVSSGPVPSPGIRTTRCATGPESTYAPVRVVAMSELAEVAAQADALAQDGSERGLADESPAARGSALLSVELLSRDHPSTVNNVRPLLHTLATADGNAAVRRLAILSLKNGSPQRETIVLLEGLGEDDEADAELRRTAASVAQQLKRRAPKQAKR